jgi:hypothetical protein
MAVISIRNLDDDDLKSFPVGLQLKEKCFVEAAVKRAIDTRKIVGGTYITDGLISTIKLSQY